MGTTVPVEPDGAVVTVGTGTAVGPVAPEGTSVPIDGAIVTVGTGTAVGPKAPDGRLVPGPAVTVGTGTDVGPSAVPAVDGAIVRVGIVVPSEKGACDSVGSGIAVGSPPVTGEFVSDDGDAETVGCGTRVTTGA